MAVIAVAGGTGGVGRTIVDALISTGKYEVKILGRKSNLDLQKELGVPIIGVDYSNVEALTKVLEDNNVHTVISGLNMFPRDGPTHEIELIHAADASSTTKRIISSDWGIHHDEKDTERLGSVLPKLQAQAELRKAKDLEYTVFYNGLFLDYYCTPAVKSYMTQFTAVLDIAHDAAVIPGSGDTPVAFTHTTDLAKFVVASLGLEKWDPESYVIGDKVTWNEFLALAEAAKGTKFNVVYDSVEKIKSGQVTDLPSHATTFQFLPKAAVRGIIASFGLWFTEGAFDFKPAKSLNDVFPGIKTKKVKEVLEEAWKSN